MSSEFHTNECAIVFPASCNATIATIIDSLPELGARIIHQYGPRVMIAEVFSGTIDGFRSAFRDAAVIEDDKNVDPAAVEELDETGVMGLSAFLLRKTPEYIQYKRGREFDGEPWDSEKIPFPPDDERDLEARAERARMQTPGTLEDVIGNTSRQMTGVIAVSTIIVTGPGSELNLVVPGPWQNLHKNSEVNRINAEAQAAQSWLATRNRPAGIVWKHNLQLVRIDREYKSLPEKEREAYWLVPTMAKLGYTGDTAVADYVEKIRSEMEADWTFAMFFTKYPLRHFGYAYIGGTYAVMDPDAGSWGKENLDRIIAHETGHIFQAPDEYRSSKCQCGSVYGIYNVMNLNCVPCARQRSVPCIMSHNTWALCRWTPYHFGFPKVEVAATLGVVLVHPGAPSIFVRGSNSCLWNCLWNGSYWAWADLGAPPGVEISQGMGVVATDARAPFQIDTWKPYVFVEGDDRQLWNCRWTGSEWIWEDHGAPPDATIAASMGTLVADSDRPYVFILGNDGKLWARWWNGSAWQWEDHGAPDGADINMALGAITVDNTRPYVFVLSVDGGVWSRWWDGSAWHWTDHGKPKTGAVQGPIGVVAVLGLLPHLYLQCEGKLLLLQWDGSAWIWKELGGPSTARIVGSMGVVLVDVVNHVTTNNIQVAFVFVRGSDDKIWVYWSDGNDYYWEKVDAPCNIDLEAAGAVSVNRKLPHVFAKGEDGRLWLLQLVGSKWSWTDLHAPSP